MKKIVLPFVLFLLFAACQRQPQQSGTVQIQAVNKFSDITLQQIYTLQDERNTKALLPYLQHNNPAYRKEAALAFASVQDSLAIPQLLGMLSDTSASLKIAAAYALGQIGHSKIQNPIILHLNREQNPQVQAALLESLGKVATGAGLNYLSAYKAQNPVALGGQAWGLYRAGLRQQYSAQGTQQAIKLIADQNPYEARLGAAQYLARTTKLDLTPYKMQLLNAATSDKALEVRMAAAQAFAKVGVEDKAAILSGIAQSDPDYRVRLSAIRAMSGLEFATISEAIVAGLTDKNMNTAVATSEFLMANYHTADAALLYRLLSQVQDGRVRANLVWAILRKSPNKDYFSAQFRRLYQTANDPYDKAHFLKALSGHFGNFRFIEEQIFLAKQPIIATSGLEGLISMRQQPDFPRAMEQQLAAAFKKAVESGDVALVGLAAGVMREPKFAYRLIYKDLSFLREAQQKLELPRDMETNIELQKTIDFLSGKRESDTPQNPFTHPINWHLVQEIPADQQVQIRTAKGDITLQLFVEDAPGTVANFVELVKQHFFNDLYFHRVVPNFVAQGGDKRGDGWGSSDYSIRSEFAPLNYREGYVGMASAGKDTESNQWFITHSPTPHLDGRYTIFARVIEGMDIVHQLEVGDKILTVELK
ncbi:peptidylprolyl isomerase [Pontibacter sp. SGAir0037]|uniref:peptidylprolyl isomerase n=1 Tax=Pontibacter sp. SGAir0037 TaxID=2571030 RepID=UPI0010CCBEA9|nr:peptidylprolyl isomerase [Pontibacter sp. SGAir0037]QCR24740.1 hypothetical protein C1N53_21880 [Pontibacter sp. SGAir0037]